MIKTISDLLLSIAEQERKILDKYKLNYGPTIGSMYEGLSKQVLEMSLPGNLDLKVVSGFGYFDDEETGELDCMLVTGEGEPIPHTDKFKWPIKDVLAVLEIKKNMDFEDLAKGYDLLKSVSRIYSKYMEAGYVVDTSDISLVYRLMTGGVDVSYDQVKLLPFEKQTIYHALVCEAVEPLRILFSYHGWKKEFTLRENVEKLIKDRGPVASGMGISSFPQLIVGGDFSLVKTNGRPYMTEIKENWWPALISTDENPICVLLELIYTKMEARFDTAIFGEEDSEQEKFSPCLYAKPVMVGMAQGWEYRYEEISNVNLKKRKNC